MIIKKKAMNMKSVSVFLDIFKLIIPKICNTTILLTFIFIGKSTIGVSQESSNRDFQDVRLEVVQLEPKPIIKSGDPGTEDNKFGFEGGTCRCGAPCSKPSTTRLQRVVNCFEFVTQLLVERIKVKN